MGKSARRRRSSNRLSPNLKRRNYTNNYCNIPPTVATTNDWLRFSGRVSLTWPHCKKFLVILRVMYRQLWFQKKTVFLRALRFLEYVQRPYKNGTIGSVLRATPLNTERFLHVKIRRSPFISRKFFRDSWPRCLIGVERHVNTGRSICANSSLNQQNNSNNYHKSSKAEN